MEWPRGSSQEERRGGVGGRRPGERGFQAGAALDHDAGALQVDRWRGSGGKRPRGSPKRCPGRQERLHSPASACPARRASDRSSSGGGGGGGGGAAPSPPPEGSTDNKSRAEKRRAGKANRARNSNTPCLLLGENPRGPRAAAALRSQALPGLQATAAVCVGGCRSLRREPADQELGVRGFKPGVGPERGPPPCSGSAHRCQAWQERRRCSWLLAVSPRSPRPLSFFPPPFPTTPAAAASKCEKCQGDFPAIRGGAHFHSPRPLFEILACPSDL